VSRGRIVAATTVSAFVIFVLVFWLGYFGIPIAVGVAYLVAYLIFRKRGSKAVRKIVFAIGIIMVIGGSIWLSFDIINGML
jgi:apolipoprotein N-acyltransferase